MKEINFIGKYPADDIGISQLFIDMFSDELVYCQNSGWYTWNGKIWRKDAKDGGKAHEMIKKMARYCLRKIDADPNLTTDTRDALNKKYARLLTKKYRDTILSDSMSVAPVELSMFNQHKFLFNCKNGTYDFKRKIFRDFERSDYLTDISNVTFDRSADCPRFEQYLQEVMEEDETKIDYLLKIAAYCLTGDTSRECFFIFYGDKTRNGKGTFVSTLTYLMGTYCSTLNASSITKKQINNGGSNPSPDLAKLKDARVANVNEISDGMLLDIAKMKELTGGDTITARFLFKEEFDFVPQFKILINTNYLPKMSEDSIFRSNRLHLVSFDRHFKESERDLQLKDKLKNEVNGIFNLLIKYYDKLNAEGFIMPQSTKDTIQQYQYNSNNVLLFVKEQLYEDKQCWETAKDIYDKYTKWCEENGLSQMANKTFKERLNKCGATLNETLARHTNSKGENKVARGWVKGYSMIQPSSVQTTMIQPELTPIDDQDLPF